MDAVQLNALQAALSRQEMARAEHFKSALHRARYLACRGILRVLLGGYIGRHPSEIDIATEPLGKPVLAPVHAPLRLLFSVSHSHGLALFAFSSAREIGVDVERIEAKPGFREAASHFLSPDEIARLGMLMDDQEKTRQIYLAWTRKEAYAKALGLGLHMDFSSVEFPPAGEADTVSFRDAGCAWKLRSFQPEPGSVATLAARGDGWIIHPRLWQRNLQVDELTGFFSHLESQAS